MIKISEMIRNAKGVIGFLKSIKWFNYYFTNNKKDVRIGQYGHLFL